jgi:hypothetical protein
MCVRHCCLCDTHKHTPTQGKQILQDGIGRATEVEEQLDAKDARKFLTQPSELLKLPSELMQNLARCDKARVPLYLHLTQHRHACSCTCRPRAALLEGPKKELIYLVTDVEDVVGWCCVSPLCCSKYGLTELVCMGGFDNTRQEVSWEGFTLELDETKYPWGTLYELEAETVRGMRWWWWWAGGGGWQQRLLHAAWTDASTLRALCISWRRKRCGKEALVVGWPGYCMLCLLHGQMHDAGGVAGWGVGKHNARACADDCMPAQGLCELLVTCVAVAAAVAQDKPEELRAQLEALLQQQDIPYSYSTTSKFANFVNKTLL